MRRRPSLIVLGIAVVVGVLASSTTAAYASQLDGKRSLSRDITIRVSRIGRCGTGCVAYTTSGRTRVTRKPQVTADTQTVGYIQSNYYWTFLSTHHEYVCDPSCHDIGSYQVYAEISLQGTYAVWKMRSTPMSGPSLTMNHRWNCIDDNGNLPNSSCSGGWQTHTCAGPDGLGTKCGTGPHAYQLVQNERYWFDFKYTVTIGSGQYAGLTLLQVAPSQYNSEWFNRKSGRQPDGAVLSFVDNPN